MRPSKRDIAVSSVANRLGIPPIDIWNYKKPIV